MHQKEPSPLVHYGECKASESFVSMPFSLFVEKMLFDGRVNQDEHITKIYYLLSGIHAKKLVLYRRRPYSEMTNYIY